MTTVAARTHNPGVTAVLSLIVPGVGQIYNGENGKIYNANISLQPDGKLRLRGYVGSPMFGETQLWTRVN